MAKLIDLRDHFKRKLLSVQLDIYDINILMEDIVKDLEHLNTGLITTAEFKECLGFKVGVILGDY